MLSIPWQALGTILPKKTIQNLLGQFLIGMVAHRTSKKKEVVTYPATKMYKKYDMHKFSIEDEKDIRDWYSRWEGTQAEFTDYVNMLFLTEKSIASVMRIVKPH